VSAGGEFLPRHGEGEGLQSGERLAKGFGRAAHAIRVAGDRRRRVFGDRQRGVERAATGIRSRALARLTL
jgi:hypothetical protein